MRRHTYYFAALMFAAAVPMAAQTTELFTITAPPVVLTSPLVPSPLTDSTQVFTFTLPTDPTPSDVEGVATFIMDGVQVTTNGVTSSDDITFSGYGTISDSLGDFDLNFVGTMFNLPPTSPSFIEGTYAATPISYVSGDSPTALLDAPPTYSIVISPYDVSATPEPSSFILLGTGLIGTLAAARRRIKA